MTWALALVVASACGGDGKDDTATGGDTNGTSAADDETSIATTADDGIDDGSSSSASDASATRGESSGPAGTSTDGGGSDSGGGETTTGAGQCEPPATQSVCGNANSIVRGIATLPVDGAPTTGDLLVTMNHEYLGSGATGGIPHTGTTIPGVDLGAGPVAFEIDMCTGGEMWSEENCEFALFVTLDANGNGTVDAGEPTGSAFVFVSCTGEPVCADIALECTDGASCLAFADPPYCGCAGNGMSCNSPIVAC